MGTLTSGELEAIAAIAIVTVVLAIMGVYLLQRIQKRKDQLRSELSGKPELIGDRAFNRIAMVRREQEILARQGSDVSNAVGLIGRAQAAFDSRQFDRAYSLAQSAHEFLVAARRGSPAPTPSSGASPAAASPVPDASWSAPPALSAVATPSPPPGARIPKNRAESQFQIHLLEQEVGTASRDRPTAEPTIQGRSSLSEAQAAFDRTEYTEAFRLALRGRRQLGGSIEALPPSPGTGSGLREAPGSSDSELVLTAEQVASAQRCRSCGAPIVADDTFCRGCGTPRTAPGCPNCGAVRRARDTFCGKCGSPFAAPVVPAPAR